MADAILNVEPTKLENIEKDKTTIEAQTNVQTNQRNKKKRKRKSNTQVRQERLANVDNRQSNRDIVMENENLVKFYKAQSFLDENEFEEFLEGLRTTLPASFRINAIDYDQAKYLRQLVKGPEFCEFLRTSPQEKSGEGESNNSEDKKGDKHQVDENVDDAEQNDTSDKIIAKSTTVVSKPPTIEPLCWYPNELGWQMNVTRIDLKKSPILQQLHRFIMAETENGFISRQEAVSMIPPLLLDIKLGQTVMDMCAAPGSKTAQLLEYLNFDVFNARPHSKDYTFDDGLVVANDVDNKRCYMLVHQANRLNSPNCVIINEDASRIPDMNTFNSNGELVDLKFDRILCDVPCSGDGTVRKNPDLWRKWSVGNANNFHGLQSKILRRGLELLKEDGLLVYSTCSMNPAEDESVIASALRASKESVVLEDISQKLKGLKYRPGVSKWTVMGRDMEPIESVEQVKPEQVSQIFPTLFSPTDDEAKQFNLHRCIRLLPHLQNTGAFFVAVLRKLSPSLPWQDERKVAAAANESGPTSGATRDNEQKKSAPPQAKKRRYGGFKEDPFIFVDAKDSDWLAIKEAYGLDDRFPCNQLMYRCKRGTTKPSNKRTICLVSKRTRDFIVANQEEPDRKEFVKLINGGMRLFARADSESGFRICQDGVNEILPFVKDNLKVEMNRDDLVGLLKQRNVTIEDLSSGAKIRDNVQAGSFIMIYKHTGPHESFEMPLVAWKGERSVALYVSKTFRIHLCALAQLKVADAVDL